MWAMLRRLRFEGAAGTHMSKQLTNMFWDWIEQKIRDDGTQQMFVSKYLKNMQDVFYNCVVAFDEALCAGDASDALLAEVIWRQFYSTNENVDLRHLNMWVRYLHFNLSLLDYMDSAMVMNGAFSLYPPDSQFVKSF